MLKGWAPNCDWLTLRMMGFPIIFIAFLLFFMYYLTSFSISMYYSHNLKIIMLFYVTDYVLKN